MIIEHEGLGGWTIEVKNGADVKRFECSQFVYTDENGIRWFDLEAGRQAAEKYDREHQHVTSRRR